MPYIECSRKVDEIEEARERLKSLQKRALDLYKQYTTVNTELANHVATYDRLVKARYATATVQAEARTELEAQLAPR